MVGKVLRYYLEGSASSLSLIKVDLSRILSEDAGVRAYGWI